MLRGARGAEAAVSNAESLERREVYYSGRVQGVGFRYTVDRLARNFRVAGYVRNLVDGRVEMVAEGSASELSGFLDAVEGALGRHIRGVQQNACPATGEFDLFEIRF